MIHLTVLEIRAMTKEEFIALADEYQAIEYALSGGCLDKEQYEKAEARQIEICRLQDSVPWEFNEDGEVVESSIEAT